ncbi:MAG: TolC family protein, partial [Elusimicrobia bacterium]|nr:TolC family protein [Elusimicrobiota bacterium]
LARLEGQLPEARGREETAQEVLRFLTGFDERLAPGEPPAPAGADLEAALRAARSRPDVEARRRERDAALFASRGQRRERWPVVGLAGAWYLHRVGFQENIKWDMTFSAALPLFAGGQATARVAQADARLRAAEERLRGAERLAESEVRRAWAQLKAAGERWPRRRRWPTRTPRPRPRTISWAWSRTWTCWGR